MVKRQKTIVLEKAILEELKVESAKNSISGWVSSYDLYKTVCKKHYENERLTERTFESRLMKMGEEGTIEWMKAKCGGLDFGLSVRMPRVKKN